MGHRSRPALWQSEVATITHSRGDPMSVDHQPEQTAVRTHPGAIFVSLELSRATWLVTALLPGSGEDVEALGARRRRCRAAGHIRRAQGQGAHPHRADVPHYC